jgi:hypothetical protein
MAPTNSNGLTADNSQPAETYTQDTNDLNFATGTRRSKAVATQIAELALTGHAVHKGCSGDFLVCKNGMSRYCQDLDELVAFACKLGAHHA